MTFPTASSSIDYNEAGEVMGWSNEAAYYEPEFDLYEEDNEPEHDVWGDPETCQELGWHGDALNKTNEGTWECAACGEQVEHTDPWETLLNEA